MSDLHDLMHSAATTAPGAQGLLAAAHRAARDLQRRRMSYAAVGTAGVVATVAAGTGLLSSASPAGNASGTAANGVTSSVSPVPSASAGRPSSGTVAIATPAGGCQSHQRTVSPVSVATQVGLLSGDPSDRLVGKVAAYEMLQPCSLPTPLIFQATVDNVVTQTLTVNGPDQASGAPTLPAASGGPMTVGATVALRGTTGDLTTLAPHQLLLNWSEPNGSGWSILSTGLTKAQLLSAADGLTLAGTPAAAPSSLPAGMVQLPGIPAESAVEQPSWIANYTIDGKAMLLSVRAGTPDVAGISGAGSHLVTVRGHAAEASTDGTTHTLSWQERSGLRVDLAGVGLTDEQVAAFAATLTAVSPDDPRLR
jgi:hypothetical protein